jgi:hypothetical protein
VPSFSLSTIQGYVLDRLDGNSTLYTSPELTYVINECIGVISLFTGFFKNTVQLPGFTVANQRVYTTPNGMLAPVIISFEGRQLQRISLRKLARARKNFLTDNTTSFGPPDFWAPIGIGMFLMSPIDSVGGHSITLTGIGQPPLLVNPTDVIVLENEYVEMITAYCAHRLPLKIGGKIFADGSLELNEFYDKLKQRARYEAWIAPKYSLIRTALGANSMRPAEGVAAQ